jgi:hypothetical protein
MTELTKETGIGWDEISTGFTKAQTNKEASADNKAEWDAVSTGTVTAHRQFFGQVNAVIEELGLSKEYAAAFVYLRTQPHWSQDLENELLALYQDGARVPNMLTWGR